MMPAEERTVEGRVAPQPTRKPLGPDEYNRISDYFRTTSLQGESWDTTTGLIKRHLDPNDPKEGAFRIEDGRNILFHKKRFPRVVVLYRAWRMKRTTASLAARTSQPVPKPR